MSPIQQMLLGVGAVASKPYVDDVFSTYLWRGNGSNSATRTMANGVDLAGEGGMVWIKQRTGTNEAKIVDTVRGLTGTSPYYVMPSETNAQGDRAWNWSFLNNGFSFNQDYGDINGSNEDYASWSFRKAKGFFTICEWTGNATNRTISHDLGCVPGLILIKRTDVATDWMVYHRSLNGSNTPSANRLHLNTTVGEAAASTVFNSTEPTSTTFGLGTHYDVNGNNGTFIAYLFAGGEANLASVSGARCVVFDGGSDGNGDYLQLASTADLSPGSGDFTFEAWIKPDTWRSGYYDSIWTTYQSGTNSGLMITSNGSNFVVREAGVTNHLSIDLPPLGQWTHVAVTRSSSTLRIFINGTLKASASNSTNFATAITSIASDGSGADFKGSISNLRFVKGTAVYTSSFRPPTAPLTNITNTKLLCCNHENRDGSTVTPGTITAEGNPVARYFSPFDDPAGFVFGDAGDQGIIKCGSYVGSGSAGLEVNLGWEPQFLIIKRSNDTKNWTMFDNMRGIATDGNDAFLYPNLTDAESATGDQLDLTPTGFKIKVTGAILNGSGDTYIWMACRRPDGYVGKPIELGTDVFAMDSAASDEATIPNFDSGFPVDFALMRKPSTADSWMAGNRLLGTQFMYTDATDAEATESKLVWDSNLGIYKDIPTSFMGWLWKRHAGMDVICYEGDGVNGRSITHSMNDVPEMMIVKRRSSTEDWTVYHTGLTSVNYHLTLNSTGAEVDMSSTPEKVWKSAPTATHFEIGSHDRVNTDGQTYLALLFSSIDGISKVGYFSGSNSSQTISLGFQPRFFLLKNIDAGEYWPVYDSSRGFNKRLAINNTNAQATTTNWLVPTSSGVTIIGNELAVNQSGSNYIYYAHA